MQVLFVQYLYDIQSLVFFPLLSVLDPNLNAFIIVARGRRATDAKPALVSTRRCRDSFFYRCNRDEWR